MNAFDHWALGAAVFLPAVAAGLLLLVPRAQETAQKAVALVFTVATTGVGVYLLTQFDYGNSRKLQFVVNNRWIDVIHSRYHVGIDGISLPMVALSMLISLLCVVYSWDHFPEPHNPKAFLVLLLVLETGMNGTFVAQDLILFFVFFELVLLPMYFMIGVWGGPNRQYAAIKFFLFTLFGSALMILSFLALYFKGGQTFDMVALQHSAQTIAHSTQLLIFAGLFMGFAIKVPMFPFHTWLPDAHVEAPTAGSVILAGVLLKMGTYGFLRFCLPLFPDASVRFTPWMFALAVIGIIYGAWVSMVQPDIKKLVAYSSVSHLGFVVLGLFTLTPQGLVGGIIQMVNHGLSTGALFLVVGMLYERRHTRLIAEFGGLWKPLPALSALFLIVCLSSLGLPGLNGFVGEVLILLGAFQVDRTLAVFATTGIIFAAVYLLWMYQRVIFGVITNEANRRLPDLSAREWAILLPILLLIVWIGVYPASFTGMTEASVEALIAQVQAKAAAPAAALLVPAVVGR